jgi:predicted nucleotide-binding protein
MDEKKKIQILKNLELYKEKLYIDVVEAYDEKGSSFGQERFNSWKNRFSAFLDEYLPGEKQRLNSKFHRMIYGVNHSHTPAQHFWRYDGSDSEAFIDSLITDITNDEYEFKIVKIKKETEMSTPAFDPNKIFIVHGHDDKTKIEIARYIERLQLEAVILHEQPSGSRTIIEKIEEFTNVGFAIVLYTPDDKGNANAEADQGTLNPRARQNVVFEHGYLISKLGRSRVIPVVTGNNIEIPSDISGIVYLNSTDWKLNLAKELRHAGYTIDFSKIA